MHYIRVPATVTFRDHKTGKGIPDSTGADATIAFWDYAEVAWFADKALSDGGPLLLRKWAKILDAFETAKTDEAPYIALEDEHHTMLVDVVKKSKGAPGFREMSIGVRLEMQCLCFAEAVLDAKTDKPSDFDTAKADQSCDHDHAKPVNGAAAMQPDTTV